MSAIFGIWNLDGRPVNKDHVYKMRAVLTRCDSDAQDDVYIKGSFAAGCCLNRISPYSKKDTPVYTDPKEKMILVADALIYNREELINDYGLAGDINVTNNELFAAAYRKWGQDFPKYVNGDFIFAIWDNGKLVLGRDHLGVRPLYYYYDEAVFVFATDYRAILALPIVPKKIDEKSLYDLLGNYNLLRPEDTFFEGVKKILPAHTMSVYEKRLSFKKYWAPGSGGKIICDTEEEYKKALYNVVLGAVKRRIHFTDAKIGADLSGGLDSAVVDILADRELRKADKKISLLFSWAPSFETYEKQDRDERIFIEEICEQEGFECLYTDADKFLADYKNLDKITEMNEKFAIPMNQAFGNARSRDIAFMLSGWGGDEGISHRAGLLELLVNGYWRYYLKEVSYLSKGSIPKFVWIIFSSTIMKLFKTYGVLSIPNHNGNITNKTFKKARKRYGKRPIVFSIFPEKYLVSGGIQTRTELAAWMGADYKVQYLFPFLDHTVVDFALNIPRHLFYKNGTNRYIFRKTFEEILPKDLCYYIPKDDIARCTYFQGRKKEQNIEKELLDKLNKTIFSKYIDFNRVKELLDELEKKENAPLENKLRKQLFTCYCIQKQLGWAENFGDTVHTMVFGCHDKIGEVTILHTKNGRILSL